MAQPKAGCGYNWLQIISTGKFTIYYPGNETADMQGSATNDIWKTAASIWTFLLFALMLSLPSGYSYGAALLLLTSLAYLLRRPMPRLAREDRIIACVLLLFFAVALAMFWIHGNKARSLDESSRCLLAIPILLLLLDAPPRLAYLWAGLAVGALAAAGVAAWQIHGSPDALQRATGFVTSAVPFGDMGLAMGVLCAAGLAWAARQGPRAQHWRAMLLAGFAAGLYCSMASGSRGGWLALPPVAILFCVAFLNKRNAPKAIMAGMAAVIAVAAMLAIPETDLRLRYDEAVTEVADYVERHDPKSSIGGRLEVWRAAAISIPQRPLLGWSHKDYPAHLQGLIAAGQVAPYAATLANTHNNYLEAWLFQGLPGLLALLALLAVPFWLFCKRLRHDDPDVRVLALSGAALQVCFFIFGLTHVILGRNSGMTFFVLALVILWACMRQAERPSLLAMYGDASRLP